MKRLCIVLLFLSLLFISPSLVLAQTIKINEFSSADNPELIELYNTESGEVNLNGWLIYLDETSTTQKITLGESDTIAGKSFKIIEHSYANSTAWLRNDGDIIILKDSSGNTIDSIKYGDVSGANVSAPSSGQSAGRDTDGSGVWTIFSTPTKGSSNNSSPTPSSVPTPTPTNQSPTNTPTSPQNQTIFDISSVPPFVNSSQSFTVNTKLEGFDPNTQYYLKGAFIRDSSSNYFGKTKVSDNWIKNNQSYSSQFPITTNSEGKWQGNLEIMADEEDSGFESSGDYTFKVGKYSATGSGPGWSNSAVINIIKSVNPSPSPIPTPTKKLTPTPTISKNPSSKPSPTPQITTTKANLPKSILAKNYSTETSVLGASSASDKTKQIKPKQKFNPFMVIGGGILVIIGINLFVYFLRNR